MAQYDIFALDDGTLVLDVQSALIADFGTRIVVPLLPLEDGPSPAVRLHPVFEIDGTRCVMATQLLAAVPAKELQYHRGSLGGTEKDKVTAALDMLFHGF